ncbi:NEL-type E3 ubiquitin ligase domain-containing protein [Pseudomonas huaxiensis]|uniref:NEL-type E3 ubiquitin ligase domain-containing protein n=1 Tax=Pseudomonas huaxiensis TaxID=2213017 RepID=UPI000DA6CFAA|nr:NEL-type E3 ubiquitin ligase domain-containing protein [Pseudomonas huaxiensis]
MSEVNSFGASVNSDDAMREHYEVVKDKIPGWLVSASSATHRVLRQVGVTSVPWFEQARRSAPEEAQQLARAYADHRSYERKVDQILAHLPSPEVFAEPLLKAAIKQAFGLDVDVRNSHLFHPRRAAGAGVQFPPDPPLLPRGAMAAAVQPLLKSALQNFEDWETSPGAMDCGNTRAVVVSNARIEGMTVEGAPLDIAPEKFAALCRTLDLGARYQALIASLLSPPSEPGDAPDAAAFNVRGVFTSFEQSAFLLQVQLAFMRNLIDPATRDALRQIAKNRPATLAGKPLGCSFVQLWGVTLTGIVVISPEREFSTTIERVLVYIPDDPFYPLCAYDSSQQFIDMLRESMLKPGYLAFFERFVPARDRALLFANIQQAFYPNVWNTAGWYEVKLDSKARLLVEEQPFTGHFLSDIYRQKVAVLKADGLFHAVPTAVEDQKSLEQKVAYFFEKAFEALNIASFVVPGLGEVMLGIMAVQLAYETFEGIDSLAGGERDQAWGYFMDVVENVAMVAALGAIGAGGRGFPALEVPSEVRQMRVVRLPDGGTRLWKPDLAPFAHDIVLPAGLKPNAAGFFEHQGKQWWPLDGRTYAVKPPTATEPYRLEHPARDDAYEPRLRDNGAGGWLHELDQPRHWQGLYLFRRLGYTSDVFTDDDALRILRISDTPESVMRHALAEGQRAPALLEDTAQRLRLGRELELFIAQLHAGDATADLRWQLQLLTADPHWPPGRGLVLRDAQGSVLHECPGARVIQVPVDAEDVLGTVLLALDDADVRGLLAEGGSHGRPNPQVSRRALRQRLAFSAPARRAELFDTRYAGSFKPLPPAGAVVRRDFPGLPVPVVEELLRHASPAELQRMVSTQRLPMRIAEEARAYLQNVRVARAYEGIFLDAVDNPDSEKLILHSVARLPGWSPRVRLEVREAGTDGALIDRVGSADAPIRKILVRQAGGFQAHDADGQSLHGRENLCSAVLHALPDPERGELGFPHVGQGAELKQAVQRLLPLSRSEARDVLRMQPLKPSARSPMRLADGRPGYPLSGRGVLPAFVTEERVLDKIRCLEFQSLPPEAILRELYASGLSRAAIDTRLDQLLDEQQALRHCLEQWTQASASVDIPGSRVRIGEAIWHHWEANSLPETGRNGPLRLENVSLRDFPEQLPAFVHERIYSLELIGVDSGSSSALSDFFRRFSCVTSLAVRNDPALGASDLIARVLEGAPQVRNLMLTDVALEVTQATFDSLGCLAHLERLDLSGNRISQVRSSPVTTMNLPLRYLGLERMRLSNWPDWLDSTALGHVAEVSLADNEITQVPAWLADNAAMGEGPGTRLSLLGNRLSVQALRRLRFCAGADRRFSFDLEPVQFQRDFEQLRNEHRVLSDVLDEWAEASTSSATPSEQQLRARRGVREVLLAYWRERAVVNVPLLQLDAIALGDFPDRLPPFFYESVQQMELIRPVADIEQFNRFLRRFTELRGLKLSGHTTPLSVLPPALLELRELTALALNDQGLTIDQSIIEFLCSIPELTFLGLDGNTMVTSIDCTPMLDRYWTLLSFNNVGLQAWPEWVDELLPELVEMLGLEHNAISELPQYLRDNRRDSNPNVHVDIALRGNPLTYDTVRQAHVSQAWNRPYTFHMDVPEDIQRLPPDHHDSDSEFSQSDIEGSEQSHSTGGTGQGTSAVEPWLAAGEDRDEVRRRIWLQLETGNDARDLLGLIGRLRHTADYRGASSRPELVERVWRVLDAAAQDPGFRLTLNGMAEEPLRQVRNHDTCPDGIRLEFNQMELQLFIRQSLGDVPEQARGQTLYRLTRRLFRSQALDDIARRESGGRDEAEVRLAYRLHWANDLELPVPPSKMLYQFAACIRPGELDQALAQVHQAEQGQEFLDYASQRNFWVDYLRETNGDRFRDLKDRFEARVLELTDLYPGETADELGARIRVLEERLRTEERQLIDELTKREGSRYA